MQLSYQIQQFLNIITFPQLSKNFFLIVCLNENPSKVYAWQMTDWFLELL